MNFLPLWTASVWPTNSGRIVDRLDHVFSTFFWRERFSSSTRPSSRSSTYGPFFSDRPIASSISSGGSRYTDRRDERRDASCTPWSDGPTASSDDCPFPCPRRLPWDGPPDS